MSDISALIYPGDNDGLVPALPDAFGVDVYASKSWIEEGGDGQIAHDDMVSARVVVRLCLYGWHIRSHCSHSAYN